MKPVGFFQDADGNWSSKRISSFICIITAIVVAFTTKDVAMSTTFLSAGLLLQGVSVWAEKKVTP